MAAFSNTAFFTDAFSVGAFDFGTTTDTHDGFDEDSYRRAKEEQARHDKDFRSARERLREVIARAYDPEHGTVAEEVQVLAAPYVERLESGTPRIDYAALERNKAVMADILAFQNALRAEYQQRLDDEDEDDVMLLTSWN